MRVVIDTNVFLDGEYDDNSCQNKIINEVLKRRIKAFANKKTLQENTMILESIMNNEEYRRKVKECLGLITRVAPKHVNVVTTDPEDNKILGSAVAAQADYVITSDNDLLRLEEYEGIKIVEPATFWNTYKEEVLGENDWEKFVKDFLEG